MKIAIVGAGAIGGYLGVKLALAGCEVTFVARGDNLAAIAERGMKLLLPDGTALQTEGARASSIEAAGPHDYVFLTMKAHQVAPVAATIDGLCHERTRIVTLQNGLPWWYFYQLPGAHENAQLQSVDPGGLLWQRIRPERVIGAVVYPAAELIAPGVVQLIEGNRFTLGEPGGEKSAATAALAQAMMAAGFKTPVSSDIRSELWVKLWGNLTFNPVSALTHATLEQICSFAPTRSLAERMMAEAQAVGERLGVRFKVSIAQRIDGAQAVGAHKTSMLQDLEQGKALELEALLGSVIELGQITGQPTPTLETVYALTKLLAQQVA
ncbi:MAG: 2-dehydropantoate 2-reductase, partial [Burkholderiaceae bacterium]